MTSVKQEAVSHQFSAFSLSRRKDHQPVYGATVRCPRLDCGYERTESNFCTLQPSLALRERLAKGHVRALKADS